MLLLRRDNFWPLVIVVIAALLRFTYLSEIEHNVDHAYPIWQALRTLEHGEWPLVGQGTSVLFANPALTGYLYLPVIALTRSPLGAYLLVIALNSLGVLLAYRAVRSILNTRAALIAACLMAVNPWVIEYSRATWVQSLLPFFTCALAWLLWPVLTGKSQHPQRRTLIGLIVLTLMAQTYLLAYVMLIPVGLLVLVFWRRMPKRALLAGTTILVVATAVYAAALLSDWQTLQASLGEFGESGAHLSAEAWNHAVRLISGADYPLARGQNAPINDSLLRQNLTQIAHYVILALLLAGILRGLYAIYRGHQRDTALILLLWFGLPVLLMSYVGQPVHPFYQLLGLPAGYALVGWAVDWLPRFHLKTALVIVLLVPLGLLMAINSQRYAQETAAAPGVHDLGALPLDYGIQLGQMINQYLPENGIVYAEVDEWTLNSFAGTTFPLLRDTRAPDFSIVPREGGLYTVGHIVAPDDWTPPAYTTLHEAIRLPGNGLLTVDVYPPDAARNITPAQTLNIATEEGLTLVGYEIQPHPLTPSPQPGEGEPRTLITYWRVDTLTADTANWFFTPFAQVFDETGAQISVVEGEMVPGMEWRESDVHIHSMTLPSQTAEIRLGQFDGTRQRNMIFLPDYEPLITLP